MNHDIKRMLELAAKAVSVEIEPSTVPNENLPWVYGFGENLYGHHWQPHITGRDCMILITRIGLLVDVDWDSRTATAVVPDRAEMAKNIVHIVNIPEGSDGMAETRLAVLMAAAAVGEAMP